jgi:glycosyltransferase involved in cell wall biosynthesis
LDSVVNQSFRDIEIVVINDGSTDNSYNIIKQYMEKDDRIILIDKRNEGTGPARNDGIRMARSKYFLLLDSDDCLALNAIEVLYNKMLETDCDLLIFNGLSFEDYGENRCWKKYNYFALGQNDENIFFTGLEWIEHTGGEIQSPGMKMYNRNFILENNVEFSDTCAGEDNYFFYLCMIRARRVGYLHYVGYYRRYRPGSCITDKSIKNTQERIKSFRYIASTLDLISSKKYRSLIGRQHAYYASLLWILCMIRNNRNDRDTLLSNYQKCNLQDFVRQNREGWRLYILHFFISLPQKMTLLQILFAHTIQFVYKSRSRLL